MGNALMLDRRGGGGGANLKFITATASDILLDKIGADQKGKQVVGTMPNNGAVAPEALAAGESYPIPEGYHDGNGQVTAKDLASQTEGNAAAEQIVSGYIAWVNGTQITGSMVDNGAVSSSLNCGGSYTIPAGYHNGSGKVTANSLASQTSANATAAQILSGQTAWVNGAKVTGSMGNYSGKTSTSNYVAGTFRSGTTGYVFASPGSAGYYATGSYIRIPATNLSAANIKKGVSILGITGTLAEGYWTSPLYLLKSSSTWSNLSTTGVTCTSKPSEISKASYQSLGSDRNDGKKFICLGYEGLSGTMNGYIFVRLNQTVNLTSYSYLKISGVYISTWASTTSASSHAAGTAYLGVSTNSNLTSTSGLSATASVAMVSAGGSNAYYSMSDGTIISNISSISGNYYIYMVFYVNKTNSSSTDAIYSCSNLFLSNS